MNDDWIFLSLGVFLFLAVLFASPLTQLVHSFSDQGAAVLLVPSITTEDLHMKSRDAITFGDEKIKVLIVPGHEKSGGGTQFGDFREYDANIELGEYLYDYLRSHRLYDPFLAQDEDGWHPILKKYFDDEREEILTFREEQRQQMHNAVELGLIDIHHGVEHVSAPSDTALHLYGINKWASEEGYDIVLHIHFNDYAGRRHGQVGEHVGVAVYVPESQYSNAIASQDVAKHVFTSLQSMFPASTLPLESVGVVEDQELIAIGANNSLDPASLLIEYSYIYEPHVIHPEIRSYAFDRMAYLTFRGLQKFFGVPAGELFTTNYIFKDNLSSGEKGSLEVFLLQERLLKEGSYPPLGKTIYDCPLSGNYFECTEEAVSMFQEKYGLDPVGEVGPETREILNRI